MLCRQFQICAQLEQSVATKVVPYFILLIINYISIMKIVPNGHHGDEAVILCSCDDTGYPHDGRADNTAYRHDRRADKRRYPHDREIDIQMLKMSRNGYILS